MSEQALPVEQPPSADGTTPGSLWEVFDAVAADTPLTDEDRAQAEADAEAAEHDDDGGGGKRSAREWIVRTAQSEYRLGRSTDEKEFIVPNDGPNVALFAGAAKRHLGTRYFKQTRKVIGRTPRDEAWSVIEGLASELEKEELPIRVAQPDLQVVVLDLGDASGRAVVATADGWTVVDRSPVTFRRSKAMLALPVPEPGGDLTWLWKVVNLPEHQRALFIALLVTTLFEKAPHLIALLRGEQGACKTTATRVATGLVDPCAAPTQKPPKDTDDWTSTCVARWTIGVDNVSTIPVWWSDDLCRTSTGDGRLRRSLYFNDGESVSVVDYRRCVVMNGVSLDGSLRADLAERLLTFDLVRPSEYLTETEADAKLDELRPMLLGALLDAAVAVLAHLPEVEVPRDMRMADVAHHFAAFDAAFGTDVLGDYRAAVGGIFAEADEGDLLLQAVISFMTDHGERWTGTSKALLELLEDRALMSGRPHPSTADKIRWPTTGSHLTGMLNRIKGGLRRSGIEFETAANYRSVTLTRQPQ